jgi:hypothetical protein
MPSCSIINSSSCHSCAISVTGIETVTVPELVGFVWRRILLAQGGHTYVAKTSNPATFIAPAAASCGLDLVEFRKGMAPAATKAVSLRRAPNKRVETVDLVKNRMVLI